MVVAGSRLEFERRIELPPAIVWDALVDPELVIGWLAEANIDPRVGGRYDLGWQRSAVRRVGPGVITELKPRKLLTVDAAKHGVISFRLTEVPGGSRGSSTLISLTIRLSADTTMTARVRADWQTRLDQLDGLLRGHPVDWGNWVRDHGEDWNGYLEESKAAGSGN